MIRSLPLAFTKRQVSHRWSRPPAFNNGLNNKNRPFDIENGVLTKLTDDSPAPCKVIVQITCVGIRFQVCEWTPFFNDFLYAT